MDWSKGYGSTYYIGIVDPLTWKDSDRIEITGGSISRTNSDLRQSADIDCVNYDTTKERWIRIWMDAKQSSDSVHIPLFTGIASSPTKNINGNIIETPVQCYSVLKPAEDVLLTRGWYAPVDISGGDLIKNLLRVTGAPINVEPDSPKIKTAIIAEEGETNLSMVERILNVIKWQLAIAGDGTITVKPKPSNSKSTFSALSNDILEPSITIDYDWFSCPNVLIVYDSETSAIARDDDPNSPLSTVSRGREVWVEESVGALAENENLSAYTLRRLKELQKVATKVSYTRRFEPDLDVTDIITLDYPHQTLKGDYRIISQSIQLGAGTKISEEVEKVI